MHAPAPAELRPVRRARLWPALLGVVALTWAVLIGTRVGDIRTLHFLDVDDIMRLLEVRDWLAGQSWWDVGQHRLGGGSYPMHWSRLVDLPLAALMTPLDLLIGPAWSTRLAVTLVPLVTLAAIMALCAALTRRVAGLGAAQVAAIIVAVAPPILTQASPLRIDHHGWQVVLALAATLILLGRPDWRHGALIGVMLGTLLTISLEGMPISATIVGVAALAWALEPARRNAHLLALVWALLLTAAVLHLVTRGPGALAFACDALAPPWLAMLAAGATGTSIAVAAWRVPLWGRIGLLAIAGGGAAWCLRWVAPTCVAGPFATLDPYVYRYWYLNVLEGRPLWEQGRLWIVVNAALPLLGALGGGLGWRRTAGEERARWTLLLAVAAAATLLALLVIRAGATANALAVPGAAWLVAGLLRRARGLASTTPRILATVAALLVAAPGIVAAAVVGATIPEAKPVQPTAHHPRCTGRGNVRAARQLPPGTIFAPIDVTPEIIAFAGHPAIGGGYHRGARQIATVFHAFMGSPDAAEPIVRATGARFVAVCPGLAEPDLYRAVAPNGLWSRLERGERVDWLQPVPIRGSPMLAWRVLPRP